MATTRDYQHEAAIEKPARKAERAARNRARLKMEKALGSAAIAGKEVDHKMGVSGSKTNNSLSNLRVCTPAMNNTGRRGGSKLKKGK